MIVVWRVTQRCNLACPFCGYDRQLSWERAEADPAAVQRFGRVLGEYQATTGDSTLVSWIGGEPLLWPPLESLTTELRQSAGLKISATTNGTTLHSARTREHVLEHYHELTVSVDAVGAQHDTLRGWPGGWESVRDALIDLAQRRGPAGTPWLRINVVLMRRTVEDFPKLCAELATWGINEITFNQLGGNDRPEFHPANRLLPAQVDTFAEQLPQLQTTLARVGVRLAGGTDYLRRFAASAAGQTLAIEDCGPGERFLFINERGRVAPCSFTAATLGLPIEQLDSAEAVRELRHQFARARLRERPAPCRDCHSTQVFAKFTPAAGLKARGSTT